MHRIDGAGHVNNLFVNEDPATNRPPTEVTPDILNALQGEVAGFIEYAGIVLAKADNTQLKQALLALFPRWSVIDQIITSAGIVIDHNNPAQMLSAIQKLIEARVGDYALDTGTANAKVVALNPAITSYTGDFSGAFKNVVLNAGACTVNFGGGAVSLVTDTGGALAAGDLPAGAVIGYQYINADGKAYITSLVLSQAMTQTQGDARYVQQVNSRIRLAGNLTLYVSTTGSDSNNGLSAGAPFLTIQKAINVLQQNYDLNGYTATVQLADGTYTAGAICSGQFTGNGTVIIQGNTVTPTNVVISTTNSQCLIAQYGAQVQIQYLKLQTTTTGYCLMAREYGYIAVGGGVTFGAAASGYAHAISQYFGKIVFTGPYTIAGSTSNHWYAASSHGEIIAAGLTITITGTPAFGTFAAAGDLSSIICIGNTFSGSATGTRYSALNNAVINTSGAGANYLPGNVAGLISTGGQYD